MNDSWYRASVGDVTQRDALQGDITTDVCIVGAGFTGLSAALELAEAGVRVTVLEAEQVGWGCSGRNGGQINPGLGCDTAVSSPSLARTMRVKSGSSPSTALNCCVVE